MKRRDIFKRLSALVGASFLPAQILEAPDPKRGLVVLQSKRVLSREEREHLAQAWDHVRKGTDWERVKVVVLDPELSVRVEHL